MDNKFFIKGILILGLFSGAVLLSWYQFFSPKSNPANLSSALNTSSSTGWKFPVYQFIPSGQVTDSSAYSELRKAADPKGLPVRLKIPAINVDAVIEDAYITPDGRMDIPAGSINVAWFALGPRPGQIGSAVIGGHYGIDSGVPKVFYKLNTLRQGDQINVLDDQGKSIIFRVREIKVFDRDADATSVFVSSDGLAHLNLVTCDGEWNKVNDSYPNRRVIFTDKISLEDSDTPSQSPISDLTVSGLPLAGIYDTEELSWIEYLSENPLTTLLYIFVTVSILSILIKTILKK